MSLGPLWPRNVLASAAGVGIRDRAEQTADEREQRVTIAGADLRECRARAGARERDAGAEDQAAHDIRCIQRGLRLQLYVAEAVEHGEHDRPGRDRGEKNLEHDEIRSCIWPTMMPGSNTRDFSSAKPNTMPMAMPTAMARMTDMSSVCRQIRRSSSMAVAMPPANMAATATVEPTASCAMPDRP